MLIALLVIIRLDTRVQFIKD